MIRAFDVEGIDRHAAFGADPGEGDVESVIADRFRQPVEQTDLIARLNFDDRTFHG